MNTPADIPPIINPARSITYSLTRWDVFVSFMTVILRNRILQVFVIAGMVVNLWMVLSSDIRTSPILVLIFEAIVFGLGYFLFLVFCQAVCGLAMAYIPKHKGVVGEHTLVITEQGLLERTAFNESLHKWPSIGRILTLFGYLIVYVSDTNSHSIPKRCFKLREIGEFEADLRAHAAGARDK